jgi:hypothetical protein
MDRSDCLAISVRSSKEGDADKSRRNHQSTGTLVEQTDNHLLLPGGGGMDILKLGLSHERGCIEFSVGPRVAYVVRPQRLIFENIGGSPKDSFFLLELDILAPSGIYQELTLDYEELVETAPAEYLDREAWDRGYVDHDEMGDEIPLPSHARLITRYLLEEKYCWSPKAVFGIGFPRPMTAGSPT